MPNVPQLIINYDASDPPKNHLVESPKSDPQEQVVKLMTQNGWTERHTPHD